METTQETMNFSDALELLRSKVGVKLSRKGWNGKGLFIQLQVPDEHSKMTRPYVYLTTPPRSTEQFGNEQGESEQRVPWICSQTDLLAIDWYEI